MRLCKAIETEPPKTDDALLASTQSAGREFGRLGNEVARADSEFETVAVKTIVLNFDAIVRAYGFTIDLERSIEPVSFSGFGLGAALRRCSAQFWMDAQHFGAP